MTLAALLALLLAVPGWAMLPDEPPPPEPKPAPKATPAPKPHPKPQPKLQPKSEPESAAPSNRRFTDNRNGTVTDKQTGLIWLKDANCFGALDWFTAMASASSLASGTCGLRDGSVAEQWRLPSKEELEALPDKNARDPALPAGYPFTSVQSGNYWSSTTDAAYSGYAWYVSIYDGHMYAIDKANFNSVWPVRGGR